MYKVKAFIALLRLALSTVYPIHIQGTLFIISSFHIPIFISLRFITEFTIKVACSKGIYKIRGT